MEDDLVSDRTVEFVERHQEQNAYMHKEVGYGSHEDFNRQGVGGRIAREGLGAMNRHGLVMSATHLDRPDQGTRADRLAAAGFVDRTAVRDSKGRAIGTHPTVPLDASQGDSAFEGRDGTRYKLGEGSDPEWMSRRSVRPVRRGDSV
jgi:hypothetical protein